MSKFLAKGIIRKDGTVAENYRLAVAKVFNAIADNEPRLHGKHWTGSRKKHMTLVDNEWKDVHICKALGIRYLLGNDAPKGGVEGDYIHMILDGRNRAVSRIRKMAKECDGLHFGSEYASELFAEMVRG